MQELMKYALGYQIYISKQETPDTTPSFRSLLNDLVTPKQTAKFNSQYLKEFTFSFSKKFTSNISNEDMIWDDSLEREKTLGRDIKKFNPSKWDDQDDEDEYIAQTIDLDERKDNTQFFSTMKTKFGKSRASKADTMRGVSYKDDGKIDVWASIDFMSKNYNDHKDSTPVNKDYVKRRDSGVSVQSMMRLQSYRSIQHEPSHHEKSDIVTKSNYSALKSQIDRFSSPKFEVGSVYQGLTMKKNNSEEKKATGRNFKFGEKSQLNTRSVLDYDESWYNVLTMKEKGFIADTQPIRTGWFSPDGMYFCLGTNSKWLKIWTLNDILESLKPEEETGDLTSIRENQEIPVVFDQLNYHDGSIYCIDWADNERLIATGSNDKQIKLLVNPLLQESDPENILELTCKGHRAKIRTVCFHPMNENVLLSGGNVDSEIMIWDTESGERADTLQGHEGGTFWIKPSHWGTLFASVGNDKWLKLWDLK